MLLFKDGNAVEDTWVFIPDDAQIIGGCCATVSLSRYLDDPSGLHKDVTALGVRLSPEDDPHALAPHFEKLSVIEVDFPKYADGRGYSQAQLLRRRLGYKGELRAVGDVLRDQLNLMVRCGFDSFSIDHHDPKMALIEAVSEFSHVYQATADEQRPVFRQRSEG